MAAREEDKAMAGLLRRSLARDAGAGSGSGDCPEPEILAAYFDHALDAGETARYDLHFSRCSLCREQLAAMARAGSVGDADGAEKKTASACAWLTGPRWLMPAAAALVAVLAITGIALRMRKPVVMPANKIAMARPDAVPPANSAPLTNSAPETRTAPSPGTEPATGAASSVSKTMDKSEVRPFAPSESGVLREPGAQSPPVVGGAVSGPGAGIAGGTVGSAEETVTVTEPAPLPNAAEPAKVMQEKKAETDSYKSDVQLSVETETAPQPNARKSNKGATAAVPPPAAGVSAMNLAARQTTETAALAKMQQAQISPNLMNLQIQTPDPKILWMIASAGAIEKSEDGGATWKLQYPETRARIIAGAAPSAKICWLVGENATILRTTNGAHWKTIRPPEETDFVRVEAADAFTATVTALDGRRFSTSDGGKSWSGVK